MEGNKHIELTVVHSYRLHQEVYGAEHPLAILNAGKEEHQANLNFNYDYERLPKLQWLFHADVTFQLIPCGMLMTRTTFSFTCSAAELFSVPIMSLIIKEAMNVNTADFAAFASQNNLPAGITIPITDELIAALVPGVIETYTNYRANDDKNNYTLNTTNGLNLTTGGNTILIVKGTFMIMDHILYENPNFDVIHNQQKIMHYVPLPVYETIKWKCFQIEKGTVQLSWMHTIFFFLCVDCALQVLLGEHADRLLARAEQLGLSPLKQQEFITFSSDMLRVIKKSMKTGGMHVTNFDEQIDWNGLIR